jgi:hypothetical protein
VYLATRLRSRKFQRPSIMMLSPVKVVLQIQLHVAKEWVTIPMTFGDVFTTRIDHKSEEPNAQAVPTSGEQNSRQLHLYGSGLHTVTMEMIGKARLLAPGVRQLTLNLPSATASHAEFQFALPVELQSLTCLVPWINQLVTKKGFARSSFGDCHSPLVCRGQTSCSESLRNQ